MKKLKLLLALILFTNLTFGQEIKYVDTEVLNIRSGAGTKYDVVDKISKGEKITVLSTQGKWTEIETENGQKGFVSSKFLSTSETDNKSKSTKDNSILNIIVIGFLLWLTYKGRNIISAIFGASKGSSGSTQKQKPVYKSSNSAVYRFRVKGNGTAGGVKYVEGMNIEVAVSGLGASNPFNNIVEKLFVQEFARKYNIEARHHSAIKMLYKRDRVDFERM